MLTVMLAAMLASPRTFSRHSNDLSGSRLIYVHLLWWSPLQVHFELSIISSATILDVLGWVYVSKLYMLHPQSPSAQPRGETGSSSYYTCIVGPP